MATALEIQAANSKIVKRAANYSRFAGVIAILFMALAIGFSQVALANARADRENILHRVTSLQAELQEVRHHCEMDRKAMRDEIIKLRRSIKPRLK